MGMSAEASLPLTHRQKQIARLIVDGIESNKEIARALGLSPRTVEIHVMDIKAQMGAPTRLRLAVMLDRKFRGEGTNNAHTSAGTRALSGLVERAPLLVACEPHGLYRYHRPGWPIHPQRS